jgi:hypothetical protein
LWCLVHSLEQALDRAGPELERIDRNALVFDVDESMNRISSGNC